MFNTKQFGKTTIPNKYVPFSATTINELNTPIDASGVKYVAALELENMFRKAADVKILNVDELGNVQYDFYDGIFDINNPANTTLVLSRLEQFPTDENLRYVNHAKEVGASFIQMFRNENDELNFIGNTDSLSGEISLLTTNDEEFSEAAELIFENFPGVTAINGRGENYVLREAYLEKVAKDKKSGNPMKNEEC